MVYLHEIHAVNEWRERMPKDKMDAVAACHDENVAKAAKAAGFKVNTPSRDTLSLDSSSHDTPSHSTHTPFLFPQTFSLTLSLCPF